MTEIENIKIKNTKIHHTDYDFQKFVEDKFGVNRGLYNTIDRWFFDNGIENILDRRKEVLSFLIFASSDPSCVKNAKLKFGNGGLKSQILAYRKIGNLK